MKRKHISTMIFLFPGLGLPMMGAAGRPSDGLLSFILLFGFLFVLWGVMHLLARARKKIDELLGDIF